ncbi:alcohol dehydrogenase [Amycolatopsis balhimycina DSM 5908]|uniref:Alcohol dehydrogenase n=1 Tax=Amycolatopsis balhimycina DSM 5908 TaxID=1081091 RepID=A0A428WP72_AMYBA|nr:zinc-binding dehydrogenase [Amycolatopsis balhimycina]RSM44886.1 alcohol dehydrogenase [Amycolatopsis balhimycina DSM 5908]
MLAVYARQPHPSDPLAALTVGERDSPAAPEGWVSVTPRAMSLNMHDINTLRGVHMDPSRYPMTLGCDGAGLLADETPVLIHSSVAAPGWVGPEQLDPGRTVLSEYHQGTFADTVVIPRRNAVPMPDALTFAEAACLPTAWLTAYRMLFVTAGITPGQRILMDCTQRIGSIPAAVIRLAVAAGCTVSVVARDRHAAQARELGAHEISTPADTVAGPVDAVFDAGTEQFGWMRHLYVLRAGGAVVCAGGRAGSGAALAAPVLNDIITGELRLLGSTMGTAEDLRALLAFLVRTGLRPRIARELPLARAAEGVEAMLTGQVPGKIVFTREP